MNTLCFASNLTSNEWAAWVQAVGSILAIVIAAVIAVWVAHRQHDNALVLHAAEQRYAKTELAKTLSVLAQNCTKAVALVAGQVHNKYAVSEIKECGDPCDLGELTRLDFAIAGIPLHHLPSSLVSPTMILGATVREFRENVEVVLGSYRGMDDSAFEDFNRGCRKTIDNLKATCDDIALEVKRMQETAD